MKSAYPNLVKVRFKPKIKFDLCVLAGVMKETGVHEQNEDKLPSTKNVEIHITNHP